LVKSMLAITRPVDLFASHWEAPLGDGQHFAPGMDPVAADATTWSTRACRGWHQRTSPPAAASQRPLARSSVAAPLHANISQDKRLKMRRKSHPASFVIVDPSGLC